MRYTNILLSTKNITIKPGEILSQEFLVKAGYIRQLGAGIFSSLHFGYCSLKKIENIIREEMNRIKGVEISMPVVHPADIWRETGRYDSIDDSLVRFTDRAGRDMVLAMTHEEVVASLAKSEVSTYKQLPKLIYQIQTKFRDEARSRGGLIRVREFVMKDSYSLDQSFEGLEKQYNAHYEAYFRMFQRAGLPVISVKSDVGMMGGSVAHEYMYLTEIGEDTLFICESTGYMANKEVATFQKQATNNSEPLSINEIHTPGITTIEDLSNYLNRPESDLAKIVFLNSTIANEEKVVVAVVRGDMEVNMIKLQNLIKSTELEPATSEQIQSIGSVPGFASPINIDRQKSVVVIDDLITKSNNLVLGANKVDYHLENVCYGRDYEADFIGDIVSAFDGAMAPNATSDKDVLKSVRGVEVGNIFQLGTKYSEAIGAFFSDENGKPKPIIMGSYGIGIGRLLGCLAHEYHDERGLKLPISVAPYEVMLVRLDDTEGILEMAENLYNECLEAGIEVLYDDRKKKQASPGEKLGDADLIGIPIRVTISRRSIENGGVELKLRENSASMIVGINETIQFLSNQIQDLKEKLNPK